MKVRSYLGVLTLLASQLLLAEVLIVDLHNIDDRGVGTVVGTWRFRSDWAGS